MICHRVSGSEAYQPSLILSSRSSRNTNNSEGALMSEVVLFSAYLGLPGARRNKRYLCFMSALTSCEPKAPFASKVSGQWANHQRAMTNSDGAAKALKLSLKVGTVPLRKSLMLRHQRLEPMAGIEPATDGLRNRCSTAELHWHPCQARKTVAFIDGKHFILPPIAAQ